MSKTPMYPANPEGKPIYHDATSIPREVIHDATRIPPKDYLDVTSLPPTPAFDAPHYRAQASQKPPESAVKRLNDGLLAPKRSR